MSCDLFGLFHCIKLWLKPEYQISMFRFLLLLLESEKRRGEAAIFFSNCNYKTWVRLEVFVISYLLFWLAFIWWINFWEEKFAAFKKQSYWWKEPSPKCQFFISCFIFSMQRTEFFFSKKFKWTQVKITIMILQRPKVLCSFWFEQQHVSKQRFGISHLVFSHRLIQWNKH